jgi:hypothetical protein
MILSVKTWVAILVLAAVEASGAERNSVPVLSRQVSHFSIGKTSVLDALLWLGHDERVSLGIELPGAELSREVHVAADMTTVGEVARKILGSSNAYLLSDSDGVILIRRKGVRPPAWLDHRLGQFEQPRAELMSAGNALWVSLELDLNPNIGGFAGDFAPTEPVDEVGPFHEHGQTVRQLLIRIVASSRGAAWFPSVYGIRFSFPASINPFWTLATTSGRCGTRPK